MNLRIPNLFKTIINKVFKPKVLSNQAIEKKKAVITRDMRIGNKYKGYGQKHHKLHFGTFMPLTRFRW